MTQIRYSTRAHDCHPLNIIMTDIVKLIKVLQQISEANRTVMAQRETKYEDDDDEPERERERWQQHIRRKRSASSGRNFTTCEGRIRR